MFKGMYRFRIGDFRVIYTINEKGKEINIMVIGDRKKVYKQK